MTDTLSTFAKRWGRSTGLAAILVLCALTLPAPILTTAKAAVPIIVNTTSDTSTPGNGLCSLRKAINNANSPGTDTTGGDCVVGTGTDTINFFVSGTIMIGSTLPAIANTLTIDGSGQAIAVDGANRFQVLVVNPRATLNVNDLTIAHGNAGSGEGGGIYSYAGALTVTNSTFSGNSASAGGGIYSQSGFDDLTVANSTFSGNSAGSGGGINSSGFGSAMVTNSTFSGNSAGAGGGIYNSTALTVTNSTFSGNSAKDGDGGSICNEADTLTVTNSTFSRNSAGAGSGIYNDGTAALSNSTFSGNSAARYGGGIYNDSALTVTNSTFSGNSGVYYGGGIYNHAGTLTVTNSTLSGNSATQPYSGGIYNAGSATLSNSILAGSTGGNCGTFGGSTITNGGDNISDDGTCGFGTSTGANGRTIGGNVNPLVDPSGLQNLGGPTQTIALQPTSPAIAAVPLARCTVTTDQRGYPRPAPGYEACDIGAFEYGQGPLPASLSFTPQYVGTASAALEAELNNPQGVSLNVSSITASGDFHQTNTCGKKLAAYKTCTISVTFQPTTTGNRTGRLTVTDGASGSPQTVSLSGSGTLVNTSPTSLSFAKAMVGTTSAAKTVTLTNKQAVALASIVISTSGDFVQTNNCPATLAKDLSCTISVTFKPTATGARIGSVTVKANAPVPTVSLSGTGVLGADAGERELR